MRTKLLLLATLLLGYISPITSQEVNVDSLEMHRFVTRSLTYGIGYSNIFDEYLSPQEYKGVDFRIARETMRLSKFNPNVSVQNVFQANISYTHNRADNNNTFAGLVNWNYGLHYQFHLTDNFKLLAGGLANINGGFIYNLHNGNNPASARAYIDLDVSGMAIWTLMIKEKPVKLRYQLNVPLVGAMFSPHYGQSYYEIFSLGNKGGVIRFTSPHNHPSLRQMVSFDFPVGKSQLRLSYLCDIQQAKVNKIKSHSYSHVFMVGFVKEIYRIPGGKKRKNAIQAPIQAY